MECVHAGGGFAAKARGLNVNFSTGTTLAGTTARGLNVNLSTGAEWSGFTLGEAVLTLLSVSFPETHISKRQS